MLFMFAENVFDDWVGAGQCAFECLWYSVALIYKKVPNILSSCDTPRLREENSWCSC